MKINVALFGLGRIGIRCRTHEEQKNNIDFETVIEREQEWIESSGFNKDPNIRLGVPLLRRVLSETLIERISKELPSIIRRLDVKIAKSKGLKVIERKIKPDEMENFVGCFLTGTAAEVTPVSQINDYKFEVCTIISDLNDAYQNLVRKKESAA